MSDNYNTLAVILTQLETLDTLSAADQFKCAELLMGIRDICHRKMNASIDLLTGDANVEEES